jgi:hypothetical protein
MLEPKDMVAILALVVSTGAFAAYIKEDTDAEKRQCLRFPRTFRRKTTPL